MFYLLQLLLLPGAPAALMACTSVPAATSTSTADAEFVFGLILVGPENDHGWSEAHL